MLRAGTVPACCSKGVGFDLFVLLCVYPLLYSSSIAFSLVTCGCRCVSFRPWQYVYEIFAASAACKALAAVCTYSYFVLMWNKHCPHIHLKRAMRFTKCDTCILCTESLDQERRNGGPGWESAAMTLIRRTLEDHYRVRAFTHAHGRLSQCFLCCSWMFTLLASLSLAHPLASCLPSNLSIFNLQFFRMSRAVEASTWPQSYGHSRRRTSCSSSPSMGAINPATPFHTSNRCIKLSLSPCVEQIHRCMASSS